MFKNCTIIRTTVVAAVAFFCLMTHVLVAQQTTVGTNRQSLLERLKTAYPSVAKGLKQTKSSLSAVKTSNTVTKKCYTIKTPCGNVDGTYTTALVSGDGYSVYFGDNEQGGYIAYFPESIVTSGWYFIGGGDDLYYNDASPDELPLDGWVYSNTDCGTQGDPVSLTITETTCETFTQCREVKTNCGTFGGQYNQAGTVLGKPFFVKDDLSSVIFSDGSSIDDEDRAWMIVSYFGSAPSATVESNDNLPPATGWEVMDAACDEGAQITVKGCGCTPEPVDALSSIVINTLSATNCPINLRIPAYGSMAVITGPDNYIFSNVYRKPGPYLMNVSGIKKPGTYNVTVSAANECGEITTKVVSFVVNGQGCK